MVGGENRGMTPHSRTLLCSRQLIQETFVESATEKVVAAVHNSCSPGTFMAELCACMPGFREKLSPDLDLIRAAPGIIWLYSGAKEGLQAKNGSVDGCVRGVKAPFFRTARLTWQHSAGKQPVKGGGVCRVIWTSIWGSRHCNPHASSQKSRIQPHFSTRI